MIPAPHYGHPLQDTDGLSIYAEDGISVVEREKTDLLGVEIAEDLLAFASPVSLHADQSYEDPQTCVPANLGVILCLHRTVTLTTGPVCRLGRKSRLDEGGASHSPWTG
jgi:hypothetical protein